MFCSFVPRNENTVPFKCNSKIQISWSVPESIQISWPVCEALIEYFASMLISFSSPENTFSSGSHKSFDKPGYLKRWPARRTFTNSSDVCLTYVIMYINVLVLIEYSCLTRSTRPVYLCYNHLGLSISFGDWFSFSDVFHRVTVVDLMFVAMVTIGFTWPASPAGVLDVPTRSTRMLWPEYHNSTALLLRTLRISCDCKIT